jgi:hypothetical protein
LPVFFFLLLYGVTQGPHLAHIAIPKPQFVLQQYKYNYEDGNQDFHLSISAALKKDVTKFA